MATVDLASSPSAPRGWISLARRSGPPPGADYIPGLDGLRAFSIMAVVLGHLGFGEVIPGGLGVTIFFFISGYLITRLLWRERERNGQVDLLRFYGRRLLRLFPELIALLVVLAFVVGPLTHRPLPWLQAVAALTYWTNYYVIGGLSTCQSCAVTGHLWSLAVEEHFYIVMPLTLIACAFAPRRLVGVFLGVAIVVATWRWWAFAHLHLGELYAYKATECRLDTIAWGCLAAAAERGWPALGAFVRRHGRVVTGVGLLLLAASLFWRDEIWRSTWRYSVQSLALVALILPMQLSPALKPAVAILEWAPLRWMGRRSYAAYLWHYVALSLAGLSVGFADDLELAPHDLQVRALPMLVALTWLLAEFSYRFVYEPAQRLKPWLVPRRAAADA